MYEQGMFNNGCSATLLSSSTTVWKDAPFSLPFMVISLPTEAHQRLLYAVAF